MIGYTLPAGKYSVEVWGASLTGKRYEPNASANPTPTDRITYAPSSTFGVRLKAEY
jgi:hypothetical protein